MATKTAAAPKASAKVIRLERKPLQTPKPLPARGSRLIVKDDPDALIIAQKIVNMKPQDVLILNGPQWRVFKDLIHVIEV